MIAPHVLHVPKPPEGVGVHSSSARTSWRIRPIHKNDNIYSLSHRYWFTSYCSSKSFARAGPSPGGQVIPRSLVTLHSTLHIPHSRIRNSSVAWLRREKRKLCAVARPSGAAVCSSRRPPSALQGLPLPSLNLRGAAAARALVSPGGPASGAAIPVAWSRPPGVALHDEDCMRHELQSVNPQFLGVLPRPPWSRPSTLLSGCARHASSWAAAWAPARPLPGSRCTRDAGWAYAAHGRAPSEGLQAPPHPCLPV
ncbi:Hypothetical protein GLP15_4083 [Giardia lamblia P15]|uniref:Uncharacterized protein n=1 Tax=Giardia intestinalis (strain P15) TaxID=658858 RepID=E1F3A3_GIAIA|nr:Hypothetical protein GLP15_4083 [Giardia lamblia P15]